jgi:hypothetical protein
LADQNGVSLYLLNRKNRALIDMILERNLPFLLPFVVKSEWQAETSNLQLSHHLYSIRQQIDDNEAARANFDD